MIRKILCLVATLLLTHVQIAEAQQQTKVPRIGYLTGTFLSANSARIDAFKTGLRELGYWRGKTLSLSGDLRRRKRNGCLGSPLNLCVSR
jgi:hypothetical protein